MGKVYSAAICPQDEQPESVRGNSAGKVYWLQPAMSGTVGIEAWTRAIIAPVPVKVIRDGNLVRFKFLTLPVSAVSQLQDDSRLTASGLEFSVCWKSLEDSKDLC